MGGGSEKRLLLGRFRCGGRDSGMGKSERSHRQKGEVNKEKVESRQLSGGEKSWDKVGRHERQVLRCHQNGDPDPKE